MPVRYQTRGSRRKTLPVSDLVFEQPAALLPANSSPSQDDDRPPLCPRCHKRLVILATHAVRDETGAAVRQQLWGCPKGHSSATRRAGTFSAVTVLSELVG